MKKKILANALAIVSLCALVGCNGGGGGSGEKSKATVINVINFNGGVGNVWLEEAKARWEEKMKDYSYEDGKKGVYIEIKKTMDLSPSTINSSGYHIYFDETNTNLKSLIPSGYLLDIDDIVTEKSETRNGESISIEDKISESARSMLKGADGHYYALPHYEWYPGVTYDIELFDEMSFYLAAPEETNTVEKFGFKYIKNSSGKKSCGNDGVYGTEDDGLPSSLLELISLCRYMTSRSVKPFVVAGMYPQYGNYLIEGLWASLACHEQMNAIYSFSGELDVVTGFSDELFFDGQGVDVKKATTEKLTLTEETGYRMWDQAARYYAMSFLEMIEREGWFANEASMGTISHTDAQSAFIMGGIGDSARIGMLIEGSYWYNESVESGCFDKYSKLKPEAGERKLGWMPLPTSIDVSATEGNGRELALLDAGHSYAYINANIKDKPALVQACKDFFKFLYTDAELRAMTACSGTAKALNYELEESDYAKMSSYQKNVWKLKKNAKVIYCGGETKTLNAAPTSFYMNMFSPAFRPTYEGKHYTNLLKALREGCSAQFAFTDTKLDKAYWETVYKGDNQVQ